MQKLKIKSVFFALSLAAIASACSPVSTIPIESSRHSRILSFRAPSAVGSAVAAVPVVSTQPSVVTNALGSQNLGDLIASAKLGTLSCKDQTQCEPAVAMLSIVKQNGLIERCTGFLISEDEILTNDHCVSDSVAVNGLESIHDNIPCQDTVQVHFIDPKSSAGLTVAGGAIEYRSIQTGINSVDYAIIKLVSKFTDRTPLKMAARGFSNQEAANIIRVQMNADNGMLTRFDGVQETLNCRASHGTYLYPSILSGESALMTFGDCPIQGGNSGSPILNSDGNVGAMVQGYLNLPSDPAILKSLTNVALDTSYGEVTIGTQTYCLGHGVGSATSSCLPIGTLQTFLPSDFLNLEPEMDRSLLPAIGEGLLWSEVSSVNPLQSIFAETLPCEDPNQFGADLVTYQKGINRFMQTEWRTQNNRSSEVDFDRVSENQFTNASFGSVTIPRCKIASGT